MSEHLTDEQVKRFSPDVEWYDDGSSAFALVVEDRAMLVPMMVKGQPGIHRGRYVRSDELSGDGAAWRMLWSPPA